MGLDKLLSVSGKSGLYRLVGQMKNGIIVEGIEDGKRFPVHGAAKVSALEEISIYTEDSEIPLKEIFDRFFEKSGGKAVLSHNEPKDKVKDFFAEMVPEHDQDRVYISDMVKVVKWFNQLVEHTEYEPGSDEAEEESTEAAAEADTDKDSEKKEPAKKKAAKKTAAKPAAKQTRTPKATSSAKSSGKVTSTNRKSG